MIDPAEIAELRHAADRAREREHAGLIDAVTLRVPTIDALLDAAEQNAALTAGLAWSNGELDRYAEKLKDAAERCVRLEALLREALPLIQRAADGEYFDAWSDGRAKRLLDRTNAELQPATQLDAADRESREDE